MDYGSQKYKLVFSERVSFLPSCVDHSFFNSIETAMDFQSIQTQAKSFLTKIEANTKNVGVLTQFEQQTKLPRSYAVLGFGAVYILLVFLNFGGTGQLLSNITGFVVPGYYSLKALKTKTTDDDTKLLTYWVVFAALQIVEFWSSAILYWVPAYFLFKTVFLLFIGLPFTSGAEMVYNAVLLPVTDKLISTGAPADELLQKVQEKAD